MGQRSRSERPRWRVKSPMEGSTRAARRTLPPSVEISMKVAKRCITALRSLASLRCSDASTISASGG